MPQRTRGYASGLMNLAFSGEENATGPREHVNIATRQRI